MPELPEVEVLVRFLQPCLVGSWIRRCQVLRARAVRPAAPEEVARRLRGKRVARVGRRAKYIVMDLTTEDSKPAGRVLLHLGMSGRVWVEAAGGPLPLHAAMVWELDGDRRLVFSDPRGFGRCGLDESVLTRLGPEPLDRTFNGRQLRLRLGESRQAVKVRLLDQAVVAGLGNIYVSESLWVARISPFRSARDLTERECGRLASAIRRVLQRAIRLGSTVPLDWARGRGDRLFYFGRAEGSAVAVQERFAVYDREGQPCRRCGGAIRRAVQGGRSSYYCPHCQV
ncbi:bifunctional DNA-formamidopyrimidine glycosylase/DNA-(apurinic or apyrimidinic site) lyase [Limisphaera sp. VF-2]|jgi:formamidopyrimidine-DNA glycosylase|uniref:bifunctional DNA-formamidopyrimidine glycosylase/DNA-(apurinic or apyrimidinic site) lyase n=1 Tax=Limisphaera sp. VF-2 TaxID=3400418 RepID=UPI00175AE68C